MDTFESFIIEHENDDVAKLLLKAQSDRGLDLKKAAEIIEGRRKAKSKIPEWYLNPAVIYPGSRAMEQCSSQSTARYKQRFVSPQASVLDITGGLGVDDYFLSKVASKVTYLERNPSLCEAARHNFAVLNTLNIDVINADYLIDSIKQGHFNLIYADPDRRQGASKRVYSISDCSPDILAIKDELFCLSDTLLVKLSPMEDILKTLELLPEATEVHIVSVDNECRELLVLMKKGSQIKAEDIPVTAVDISSKDDTVLWSESFTLREENETKLSYSYESDEYIFSPGKSLLKGGAFKLLCGRYGLRKFDSATHIYSSNEMRDDFPGKIFRKIDLIPFSKGGMKMLAEKYPQCNIVAKNLPISTNELRNRLKIKDGGDIYVFAVKLHNSDSRMIVCKREIISSARDIL